MPQCPCWQPWHLRALKPQRVLQLGPSRAPELRRCTKVKHHHMLPSAPLGRSLLSSETTEKSTFPIK